MREGGWCYGPGYYYGLRDVLQRGGVLAAARGVDPEGEVVLGLAGQDHRAI